MTQYNTRINEEIRAKQVRTIDHDGRQAGILPTEEALRMAQAVSLDLVEVAPDATPPVCRIMDFGKYRYALTKKEKEAKKKQHVIKVKEIKMRPNIEDHDYEVKLKQAMSFLQKGNKVKITMMFKGREMVHQDIGQRVIQKLIENLKGHGNVEMEPKLFGKILITTFAAAKHH